MLYHVIFMHSCLSLFSILYYPAWFLNQGKLGQMIGSSSGFVESLPKKVRNRVCALQDIQKEHDDLEEEYKKEKAALDAKYISLYGRKYLSYSHV